MDAIGKIVATMLANTVQDESGKVEKKDKMSASEMRWACGGPTLLKQLS